MAKYQVLRPIEHSGTLYKPKPGPDEAVSKTTKSAGNGREIPVNSDSAIELAEEDVRAFTLGQLGTAGIPMIENATKVSQPALTIEPLVSQFHPSSLTRPAGVTAQPDVADAASKGPVETVSPKQPSPAKPLATAKPQADSLPTGPAGSAPSTHFETSKLEPKAEPVVSGHVTKPAQSTNAAARVELGPLNQTEAVKPLTKKAPVASAETPKPAESAKLSEKVELEPLKQTEAAKPMSKPEPVAGGQPMKPSESGKSAEKVEPEPLKQTEVVKLEPKPGPETKAGEEKPAKTLGPAASTGASKQSEPAKPVKPKNG